MLTVAQDQGDFQPLRRIGFSNRARAGQWLPLTADQRILWHSSTLLNLLTCAAQDLRTALQRHEAAAGPNSIFLFFQAGIAKRPDSLTMPQIFVKIKGNHHGLAWRETEHPVVLR